MAFDKTRARCAGMFLVAASVLWAGSCGGGGSVPTIPASTPAPAPTPAPTPAVAEPAPSPPPTTIAGPPPEPTPEPTPETCPTLTAWTSRLYKSYDSAGRIVDHPVVGGLAIIDSTPRFNGQACNLEHPNCGGRECEDPRGGNWKLLEGDSPARAVAFQFRIGPLVPGTHRWQVCPLPDVMDAQEDPVQIGPDPCSEGTFDVN